MVLPQSDGAKLVQFSSSMDFTVGYVAVRVSVAPTC